MTISVGIAGVFGVKTRNVSFEVAIGSAAILETMD
jgi:hypothetical protein